MTLGFREAVIPWMTLSALTASAANGNAKSQVVDESLAWSRQDQVVLGSNTAANLDFKLFLFV